MSGALFVWVEQHGGIPLAASWQAIGLARQLGGSVTALVFGQNVDEAVKSAFQYGADAVIKASDPSLAMRSRFAPRQPRLRIV